MDGKKLNKKRCEDVYEMEDIIGEGTFSSVVRGIHNTSLEAFAIKIIDKTKIETQKQLIRIYNEISIHKRAKHPYIVNYLEHYETDIDVCIVMELCRGGELFNRIVERGTFSEKETSSAMRQLLKAVEYLHNMGIVHRDIKPENLLYTNIDSHDCVVKLADFGLAKQLESKIQETGRDFLKASLSGTPAYCAPERLNNEVESKAVDMWSVGCIVYFLLFGVPPFYSSKEDEDENEDEIFDSVLEGNVKFLERPISDNARDFILKLLDRDPTKRYTAEQALKHPFIKHQNASSETEGNLSPSSSSNCSSSSPSSNVNAEDRTLLKQSINRIIEVKTEQDELSEGEEDDDDS